MTSRCFPARSVSRTHEVFARRDRDSDAEYALVWIDPSAAETESLLAFSQGTEDDDPRTPSDVKGLG